MRHRREIEEVNVNPVSRWLSLDSFMILGKLSDFCKYVGVIQVKQSEGTCLVCVSLR